MAFLDFWFGFFSLRHPHKPRVTSSRLLLVQYWCKHRLAPKWPPALRIFCVDEQNSYQCRLPNSFISVCGVAERDPPAKKQILCFTLSSPAPSGFNVEKCWVLRGTNEIGGHSAFPKLTGSGMEIWTRGQQQAPSANFSYLQMISSTAALDCLWLCCERSLQ